MLPDTLDPRRFRLPPRLGAILLLLPLGAVAFAQNAPAPAPVKQTAPDALPLARDIVARSYEAMGGAEALARIESSRTRAMITNVTANPIQSIYMDVYSARPDNLLVQQSLADSLMTSVGYNGEIGWHITPFESKVVPIKDIDESRKIFEVHREVRTLHEIYKTMETIGRTTFAHRDCYQVRMSRPGNADALMYFDVETGLFVGKQLPMPGQTDGPMATMTVYNWRPESGVQAFRRLVVSHSGQEQLAFDYTEVEWNKVDPAQFDPPQNILDLAKEQNEPATRPAGR